MRLKYHPYAIFREERNDRDAKRKPLPFKPRFRRNKLEVFEPCKSICVKCLITQVYVAPNAVQDDKVCDTCRSK